MPAAIRRKASSRSRAPFTSWALTELSLGGDEAGEDHDLLMECGCDREREMVGVPADSIVGVLWRLRAAEKNAGWCDGSARRA
jgi:hypothetical protein